MFVLFFLAVTTLCIKGWGLRLVRNRPPKGTLHSCLEENCHNCQRMQERKKKSCLEERPAKHTQKHTPRWTDRQKIRLRTTSRFGHIIFRQTRMCFLINHLDIINILWTEILICPDPRCSYCTYFPINCFLLYPINSLCPIDFAREQLHH